MPKTAIMTIVHGEKYREIWKRTEPFFNEYADRCESDLLVLKDIPGNLPSPHWAKFAIRELLKKQYDRIAFIDADIIIRKDCPSLFDVVPEDHFGIFNEGFYTPRSICIHEVKKVYDIPLPKWDGKTYYNTGVMVVSRQHRHIFNVPEEVKPLRNSFGEQTYINMKLLAADLKIHSLHYKFNRMSLMDRITGMTRLDSYIIHYAGDGDNLLVKMDRDIKRWAEDESYNYRRKILIWALGGLGDCVCAEPTIRHMREEVYPDADLYVMSKFHHLYHHIQPVTYLDQGELPKDEIDAVSECYTHPSPLDKFNDFEISFGNHIPHLMAHAVDWISLNVCNRMMPLKDREIRLHYTEDDENAVLTHDNRPESLVLIHAGMGWETKTFPLEWWQEVVDGLDAAGIRVGLIGANVSAEHGYVPVACPPNGVDYRDKLTIPQLVALIAKAKVLISNDSAPIHIAGAFENYIILIPTCKEGDLLMPYRKNQQYWRAASMMTREIHKDQPVRSTDVNGWQTSHFPEGHTVWEYIPDAADVLEKAKEFYAQACKADWVIKPKEIMDYGSATFSNRNYYGGVGSLESDGRGPAYAVCGYLPDDEGG